MTTASPAASDPSPSDPATDHLTIEQISARYIDAKVAVDGWDVEEKHLKAVLIRRMQAESRSTVDVPGKGGVAYKRGSTQHRRDDKKIEQLLGQSWARLEQLGETPDKALPTKIIVVSPTLSVSLPPPAEG